MYDRCPSNLHMQNRPEKSPLEDPRAWWKYAYLIVSGKSRDTVDRRIAEITNCLQNRQQYISLVKQRHTSGPLKKDQVILPCVLAHSVHCLYYNVYMMQCFYQNRKKPLTVLRINYPFVLSSYSDKKLCDFTYRF